MGRLEAFGVCTGLLCLASAAAVDAAPRGAYFGPGGSAPRAPEIMVYFSHSVGAGAGGGSMRPTFGLRVQQIRQAANNGDPEQGDGMQHRELLNWQMEARSNMHFSQSRVKLGNKLTYDFASSRFGAPSRSLMQIGTPSLRNGFAKPAQATQLAARNPAGGFSGLNPGSRNHDEHDAGRDNSGMRDIAAAAIAALTPSRFTAAQRQTAQHQRGITAIAAAQRMQTATTLR